MFSKVNGMGIFVTFINFHENEGIHNVRLSINPFGKQGLGNRSLDVNGL
jgi:hypothetical protein